MKPNNITRAIIDATVDRTLREVAEDPQRSIRKLADLGRSFSKKTETLNSVYDIVQDLLRNDDSPYYTAIDRFSRHIDRKGLKNFFINVGYNSLTFGAKIIKENEASASFYIPWCLILHTNPSQATSIDAADISQFVKQGNDLGIYTFIILLEGQTSRTTDLLRIFAENSDSAFVCMLPDTIIDNTQFHQMAMCTNTLFYFRAQGSHTDENVRGMQAGKLFYGIYDTYTDATADQWILGSRTDTLNQNDAAMVMLVPAETCSQETRLRMGNYVRRLRTQPLYPFIPLELSCDAMILNKFVSEETCYFELLENGDILTKDDTVMEYRHTLSLRQMLSFALPKK
ncbi:MAG: hypothetical protein IJI10_03245 [Eubacterium sp.]|nr:hypothetical protein [Eubacterium sp.]